MGSKSSGQKQVTRIPTQPKAGGFFGRAEYAAALHSAERDLKVIQEKLEALRYSLIAQDNGPTDLFTLLGGNACHFLSVEELAQILKVDSRTIYGLRSKGLTAHRVGKELRFDPLEVADWLRKQRQA